MGAVTPETCRVSLQWINICILLHLVGILLTLNYDARNHEFKKKGFTSVKSLLNNACQPIPYISHDCCWFKYVKPHTAPHPMTVLRTLHTFRLLKTVFHCEWIVLSCSINVGMSYIRTACCLHDALRAACYFRSGSRERHQRACSVATIVFRSSWKSNK